MVKSLPGCLLRLIFKFIRIQFRYADNHSDLCGNYFGIQMKRTYHICISGGNELLCRDEEDYVRCFNCLAMACAETESILLADSVMSNHLHECVRTSSPNLLIENQRYKYSRYFNAKYGRRGRLGEKTPFVIELQGLYHTLAALSYVLRNPVHHGIAPTPFAYPHCSANVIFSQSLGHVTDTLLMPAHNISAHLPSRKRCPEGYRMDKSGLILRGDVIDTVDVEHMFGTARAFLYYMNRLSGEEWKREQERDREHYAPITIETIENGITLQTMEQMLRNEHGRNDYRAMDDRKLCNLIDNTILPRKGIGSVYQLPHEVKAAIARELLSEYRLPENQIRRCLAF